IAPTLARFIEDRVEPWSKSTFEKTCINNWRWYKVNLAVLLGYRPLATSKLDSIGGELVAEFASCRQRAGLQPSSINGTIRVLRRVLHLAVEWGVLETAPVLRMLPGERRRERVVTREEEGNYRSEATPLLAAVTAVLADTGLRPEECYSLTWDCVNWLQGREGTLLVKSGKTPAARRRLPMSPRVRQLLLAIW